MTIEVSVVVAGALAVHLADDAPAHGNDGKRLVETSNGQTISGLLRVLGIDPTRPLLIIVAGRVVTVDERSTTILTDGDSVSLSPPIRAG